MLSSPFHLGFQNLPVDRDTASDVAGCIIDLWQFGRDYGHTRTVYNPVQLDFLDSIIIFVPIGIFASGAFENDVSYSS